MFYGSVLSVLPQMASVLLNNQVFQLYENDWGLYTALFCRVHISFFESENSFDRFICLSKGALKSCLKRSFWGASKSMLKKSGNFPRFRSQKSTNVSAFVTTPSSEWLVRHQMDLTFSIFGVIQYPPGFGLFSEMVFLPTFFFEIFGKLAKKSRFENLLIWVEC